MKYRKKPVVIEAIQWKGNNWDEIKAKFTDPPDAKSFIVWISNEELLIATLEGKMKVDINDWIIKGVQGEYYPCKPDIFEQTYEPV